MNVASIGSFVVAAIALLVSIYSGSNRETKEDSARIAQMVAKLEELSGDMKEIKDDFRREMAELKAAYQSDHDRIIKLEQSLETAWKRIDEIRGTKNREG